VIYNHANCKIQNQQWVNPLNYLTNTAL